MKFSTATRHGLRAMVYIAQSKTICSVKKISEAENMPFTYLEKIILKLSKAGLIGVKRGVTGGYFLALSPKEITVEDVVKVLEKNTAPAPCIDSRYKCPHQRSCLTKKTWEKVYDSINATLGNITIEDLIK
jgi:Rrf2 family protein